MLSLIKIPERFQKGKSKNTEKEPQKMLHLALSKRKIWICTQLTNTASFHQLWKTFLRNRIKTNINPNFLSTAILSHPKKRRYNLWISQQDVS